MKRKVEFVAKHSKMGNQQIIIVPKDYWEAVAKLKNPMRVTVEEIL